MNGITFADSMRSKPVTVLRLPLLPYSVGHELILQSEKNILVCGDPANPSPINAQCAALIRASIVCSKTYRENFKRKKWIRAWGWSLRPDDFIEGLAAFQEYRLLGSSFPRITSKEADEAANGKQEDFRQLGGELMPRLLNFLTGKETSFGYSSVYEFPYGMALHLFFNDLEMEGRVHIENERERQAQKEIEEAKVWANSPEAIAAKQKLFDEMQKGGS